MKKESLDVATVNARYARSFAINNALSGEIIDYWVCHDCKLGFFYPMIGGNEALYEKLQVFDWYYMADKPEYELALNFLPADGSVLEIGSGKAAFAMRVGESRYTGLEFNDEAIKTAEADGIQLLKETIEQHSLTGSRYDAVVSFQVLEHVSEPAQFIHACVECLKPGGILILAVPAYDGFIRFAVNNLLNMPPHHLTHWTKDTLQQVSLLFELKLIDITHEKVSQYHRIWAKKIIIEDHLRKFFGLSTRLLDVSILSKLLSLTSRIIARFWPLKLDKFNGHTVVACYKKI